MNDTKVHDVIIIGSGPAGYTAAIYCARANLSPLVFTGLGEMSLQPGGQLMITTDVENYPGFPEGILGPDLMERFRQQAERFGSEVVYETVDEVDLSRRPFELRCASQHWRSRAVIVATGARARLLGLEDEARLMGSGVSACATCDGAFFRDKDVCLVGGGDSALEEAIFLTRFATKVHVIHRRDELRASHIMQERARANSKIDFIWSSVIAGLVDDGGERPRLKALRLQSTISGEITERATDGLFIAIGHTPNTDIFKGQLEMNPAGYIVNEPGRSATSVEGVFAAGDVADSHYRQAITAAGSGCMAALDAEHWLATQ